MRFGWYVRFGIVIHVPRRQTTRLSMQKTAVAGTILRNGQGWSIGLELIFVKPKSTEISQSPLQLPGQGGSIS